jgi:LysR family transcriptional regulator, regulator of abg operon
MQKPNVKIRRKQGRYLLVIIFRMKLNSLQALVAAVDEGSLRAAARRVGVSQPAMTKMIRELEVELETTLLTRSIKGVIPTPQGSVLVEQARKALRELDDAVVRIDHLNGRMVGELGIAAVPLAVLLLIPETLRTFGREFPDIQLRIREELYIAELRDLRQGEIDVALGPIPEPLPAGEFHVESLMPIQMAVVVGRASPLAQATSLEDLLQARWVYTSVSGHTGYAQTLFARHGITPPKPAAMVNSTLALMTLICSGEFVGLMPQPLAHHPAAAPWLSVVPIREGQLEMTLGAIVRQEALLKPVVRQFLAHLQRAAGQAGHQNLPGT